MPKEGPPVHIDIHSMGQHWTYTVDREELGALRAYIKTLSDIGALRTKLEGLEEREKRRSGNFSDSNFKYAHPNDPGGRPYYSGHPDDWDAFKHFRDRHSEPKAPPKPKPEKPKIKSTRDQISDLSGVSPIGLTDVVFIRRAKRACHPDTGGTHEKWIKLERLIKQL